MNRLAQTGAGGGGAGKKPGFSKEVEPPKREKGRFYFTIESNKYADIKLDASEEITIGDLKRLIVNIQKNLAMDGNFQLITQNGQILLAHQRSLREVFGFIPENQREVRIRLTLQFTGEGFVGKMPGYLPDPNQYTNLPTGSK